MNERNNETLQQEYAVPEGIQDGKNGNEPNRERVILQMSNIRKSFGDLHVLKNIDLSVRHGEVVSIIGPSGSGKSTTEKLICGHLVPSGGKIRLFGKKYTDPGVRARVGALIENTGCFPNSSIHQNLMMQAINRSLRKRGE